MWELDFITEEDFYNHVRFTIKKYGDKLSPFNLKKFNKNIVDPIKLIFDKTVYGYSWEEIIRNEIFRQRDKSNNNDIGYFHQRIFKYMKHCTVPQNGMEGGWDIIYRNPSGICIEENNKDGKRRKIEASTVYVEMKNKHNTMNSASSSKTYMKMQDMLLKDDDCMCFLVEIIAKKSQNIKWEVSANKKKLSHNKIRRVSIDKFYEIVTGDKEAFFKVCMVLPRVIEDVMNDESFLEKPKDTVIEELKTIYSGENNNSEFAITMAIFILGFGGYEGFNEKIKNK